MRQLWLSVFVLLSLLSTSTRGVTQSVGPVEIVQRYCELDAQGARLREGHPDFLALRDPDETSAEPGWDTVTVISHFTVGTPRIRGSAAQVPVTYDRLGSFSDTFQPDPKSVTIKLQLVKRADGWKIRDAGEPPHVYTATLQDHFLKMRWWFNWSEEKERVRKILYEVFRAILFEKTVAGTHIYR